MLLQTSNNAVQIAQKLAKTVLATAAPGVDASAAFPRSSLDALGREGLLGLIIPEEFGGLNANSLTFANCVAAIAGGCASTGMIFVMHCCGIIAIREHMSGSKKSDILSKAARGEHLSTLAFSERGTGSNFGATFSTSEKSSKNFILNGEKSFVTSGGQADSYVVSVRAPGATELTCSTLYVISKNATGVSFQGHWHGLGLRGNSSVSMTMKDCVVDAESVLGEQEQGLSLAMGTVLPLFLLGSASVYHGIGQAAFEGCCNHVKTRTHAHNGEPLSSIAHVRTSIARMKVMLDSSQALIEKAAEARDLGTDDAMILLMEAKQKATETANHVTRECMHICGGIAYTGALSIERHLRDALAGGIMAPTEDMLLDMIGRASLGLPLS